MKKLTLFCGAAALALASCSNDELVENIAADQGADAPIGFAVSTGNMTRAAGDPTQLSDEHWDFGVWAYKGTSAPSNLVMCDYLVGYWNGTNGYQPDKSQQLTGNNFPTDKGYYWYYEGLGSSDSGFTFVSGSSGKSASTSANDNQYLKYWDRAENMKTWFYAYAPYTLNTSFENASHTMTFPTLNATTGANAMYATTKVENLTSTPNKFVDLSFYRLLSKVRLAFYEDVAGYEVELYPYGNTEITGTWSGFGKNAMFAVPAVKSGDSYSAGSYVTEAAPQITFGKTEGGNYTPYPDPLIAYTLPTTSGDKIGIPLWFFDTSDNQTNLLGTKRTTAIKNETLAVLPQPSKSSCGFTLNLSLKFIALDTNEEIIVKGVRVHIPAEACRWLPNHLYTYYFKVTKSVPGSPGDPGTPSVTPGKDPYLLPIVFDTVTVQTFEGNEVEHDINY